MTANRFFERQLPRIAAWLLIAFLFLPILVVIPVALTDRDYLSLPKDGISLSHFASLAVIPTLDAWDLVDERFGRTNFHWFFLAQPFRLPEKLLSADPQAFIDAALARMAGGLGNVEGLGGAQFVR